MLYIVKPYAHWYTPVTIESPGAQVSENQTETVL